MSKHRCGLIEQALRVRGVAGRKDDRRQPGQRIPEPPGEPQRPESFNAAGEVLAGRVCIADGVFNVSQQILGPRDHHHVVGLVSEREGARERGAGVPEFSLRVPHRSRSEQRSRFDSRQK